MFFNVFLLSSLAASGFAFPGAMNSRDYNADPPCGPTQRVKCACPPNTNYQASISSAVWPVKAEVISNLTDSFFNTAWFGGEPAKTEGTGPGSKRFFPTPLPGGKAPVTIDEQLGTLNKGGDGGYTMSFLWADVPFTYPLTNGKTGYVGGSWDTVEVNGEGNNARMTWMTHVCLSETLGQ